MKLKQYQELVAERKGCRRCMQVNSVQNQDDSKFLINPSEAAGPNHCFDSQEIGPWTQWQGNLEADLMVVGQDWGDTNYFNANKGREKANNPTNKMLTKLMASVHRSIGHPGEANQPNIAFFTNAILCLKQGSMQASIQKTWFQNCQYFLRRQIKIVNPKVVVGLGQFAFHSILSAFGIKKPEKFLAAVEDAQGIELPNGSRAFAVYHCGARILNTHRNEAQQRRDWQRIGRALAATN